MTDIGATSLARRSEARVSSAADLKPFSIFALIYTTAILLEMVEFWLHPWAAVALLGVSLPLLLAVTKVRFLIFLVLSTAYFGFWRFPEVANHVNLILFVNAALIITIGLSFIGGSVGRSDDELYERVQPILRLIIIVTFFVAGFHKLNIDFINPEVSCIRALGGDIARALRSDFLGFGFPTVAVALAIVAIGATALWRRPGGIALPRPDWIALIAPVAATLIATAVLLMLVGTSSVASPQAALIFLAAAVVLCWQIVESLLLLIPRFQWIGLILSLAVHAQLAMINIVDFQAVALALLVTFIPAEVWRSWRQQADLGLGGIRLHRVHAYVVLNMFAGLLMLVQYHVQPIVPRPHVVTGMLFNVAVLIMVWPIIGDLLAKDRSWHWQGVPVLRAPTLRLLYAIPVALLLFGLTSHLGLRTAGNFSMFSNLRTEGATSNHLLLGSNPLKIAGYQEDVVAILDVDDAAAEIGHQSKPLEGTSLPVVEFRKLLYLWREEGRVVPITFEYRGEVISSADIANEPRWRVDGFDWEMRLLDFRVIQPVGPNECRW